MAATAATGAPAPAHSSWTGCAASARDLARRRESRIRSSTRSSRRRRASLARVFDLQHEHADEMLAPSPDAGRLVAVTHLIPRSRDDLERRRRAIELIASVTAA